MSEYMNDKKILLIVLFLCTFGVLYFSWIPDPGLEQETYLPLWIRDWSNDNYNLRTAVPFVLIGFLLSFRTFVNKQTVRFIACAKKIMINTGFSAAVVCMAEVGQFLIKTRSPDFMDIFYGILGSLIGGLGCFMLYILSNFKMLRIKKKLNKLKLKKFFHFNLSNFKMLRITKHS